MTNGTSRFYFALFVSVTVGMWPAASSALEIKTSPLVETIKKIMPTFVSIRDADEKTDGKPPPPKCGVVVDPRGIILTTRDVCRFGESITVELHDKSKHSAKVTCVDEKLGLALLKIETKNQLQAIELGDSDVVEAGDVVLIISGANGYENTVTNGLVSRIDLPVHNRKILCIDSSIGPGISQGAVINESGKMIGYVTRRCGVCPAVPSNYLRQFIVRPADSSPKAER